MMSSQIEIDKQLVNYLQTMGYRNDPIIDTLVKETKALGDVAQMQISPEQGQFLQMIVQISKSTKCLEIGRFTGLSTLCIAKGLSDNGKIITIDNSDEFLLLANKINNLEKIIIVSGLNDSYLPYYVKDFENFQTPIFGHNLFQKTMQNSSRGWKNQVLKLFFGKIFKKETSWNKINSLNWNQELFGKEKTLKTIKKNLNPEEHLQDIIDRNFMIWSTLASGMKIKIDFMLQPVGSWCKKKLSPQEEKLFQEENNSKKLQRIYQYVDMAKYTLVKDILKKSAEKHNINFLDCNDIFSEKRFDKEWLFLSRFHVTDLGNKHIAETLIQKTL